MVDDCCWWWLSVVVVVVAETKDVGGGVDSLCLNNPQADDPMWTICHVVTFYFCLF